jgi:plastocyanin
MSPRARALTAATAAAVIIIAFIVLRPSGGDEADTGTTAAAPATAQPGSSTSTTTGSTTAKPKSTTPKPSVTRVRAAGLKPVGGIKEMTVNKGDTVRFVVTSDQPENVHLHGYDVEKPVGPGKPATYTFKATIEGIFEVELEEAGVQLIKLTVEP